MAKQRETQQAYSPKRGQTGIILQVVALFALGVLATGVLTYFTRHYVSQQTVQEQTESLGARIADEVGRCVLEYPAYQWLLSYWHDHAQELDIEYDVEYDPGTRTEAKLRLLAERQPGLQLKYAHDAELEALPEEDQRLSAEIAYSWLITRVNQIKRAYDIDYLFCIMTDSEYLNQFFLFSAADEHSVRGTQYEETYTLGTFVTLEEDSDQQKAMMHARRNLSHLASAGNYVDYYAFLTEIDHRIVLIGMTHNLSGLQATVETKTWQSTGIAILTQLCLSLICLALMVLFVLRPLKKVQQSIRLYTETKDSAVVANNLSGIRSRNEIGELSEDVTSLAREIDDYTERIAAITREKERIGTELELAARIQAESLPNDFPAFPDRQDFDIYATMDPAKEVGGDFYNFFLIDDDHLAITIADVSGKGIPAALFMMVSMIILADTLHMGKSPAETLTIANAAICSNNQEEMFVTVWLGILELSTGRLVAANAGHEYPILMSPGGAFELIHDKHGFVVGGMDGVRYREYELQLEPGAKLFVYTDGVPEATNAQEELFGTERLLNALNCHTTETPEQILRGVRNVVDNFVRGAEQFDDLTMLCLHYKGQPGSQQ